MKKKKFTPLTAKELRPEGWLRQQLKIQAEGLSGHLDLIWPDIRDSKWISGDKEGWERVPYWLDGFIPLAYLLEDEELKKRAARYIDAILERQEEDGWICPCSREERSTYDVWAAFLICKVLVLYYECSGDDRIEQAVYRAMHNLLLHVTNSTLFNWSAARWYECLVPLLWLYERRPEDWMLKLAFVLEAEGLDYEKLYRNFDFAHPAVDKYWTQLNHVVNTAMAFKSRALMSLLTGESADGFAREMYEKVMRYNSMATGHFTGDECLSGDSPVQGSECCSVAEAMYSYEILLAVSGNPFWGDLLEKEAFNCLPATTTPDMWAHQYVQMTNQICCSRIAPDQVPFNSNGGEAHMFGLEPNFGCCTANFNQAWPKFALSAVALSADGLAVMSPVPVSVRIEKEGTAVSLQGISGYPFRDEAVIEITAERPVEMELLVRIPGFAQGALVDGEKAEPGSFYRIYRKWEGSTRVKVSFSFVPVLTDRPNDMKALVRGPLVFSLPITETCRKLEYVKDGVERKAPYCDYELTPASDWNYGFCTETFEVRGNEIGEYPFAVDNPPLQIKTEMVKIPWQENGGVCAHLPQERRALSQPEEKLLQPYGCTNLRMTEMPLVSR